MNYSTDAVSLFLSIFHLFISACEVQVACDSSIALTPVLLSHEEVDPHVMRNAADPLCLKIPANEILVAFGARDFEFILCSHDPPCQNRERGNKGGPKYCSVTSSDNYWVRMPANGQLLLNHLKFRGPKVRLALLLCPHYNYDFRGKKV